jgi:pimeloyl-ACP methyl ester carboxylesterase
MTVRFTTPGAFGRARTPTAAVVRRLAAISALALTVLALGVPSASAADTPILLVHGYGDHAEGKDCNGSTWSKALAYYQRAGGRDRDSMTTIGYYTGDRQADGHGSGCDVKVASATNATPIQEIAKELANHIDAAYTSKRQPVNIIAHSMGGLITRVALLGSAQGWKGFPHRKLNVDNVVTLSTPHRGVAKPSANDDRQWKQMDAGSGFMTRLHEQGSELGDDWANGTDWSLVGSDEDGVVSFQSAIDKNFAGTTADQKYGYWKQRDGLLVDHQGVRTLGAGKRDGKDRYKLNYWHAAGTHPPHTTERGWSPLKTAFKAATRIGDGLPK